MAMARSIALSVPSLNASAATSNASVMRDFVSGSNLPLPAALNAAVASRIAAFLATPVISSAIVRSGSALSRPKRNVLRLSPAALTAPTKLEFFLSSSTVAFAASVRPDNGLTSGAAI